MKTIQVNKTILFSSVCALFSALALLISSLSLFNTKGTAEDIYTKSLSSIFEFKAYSEEIGESYGTAILITDDIFVTNAHIISFVSYGEQVLLDNYYVRSAFGNDYIEVGLIDYNVSADLAFFKKGNDLSGDFKPINKGTSDNLKSGQKVFAIGNTSNYGLGLSAGYISVPIVNIDNNGSIKKVIQSDITIAEGNSGGALLNEKGKLIGTTSFRLKDKSGYPIYGLAYSIPVNDVLFYLNMLEADM